MVSYVSRDAPRTALTVRGSHSSVLHARVTNCRVEDGPAVLIGDPPGIDGATIRAAWINASRVRALVDGAPYATDGIRVDGSRVQLLPGSRVRDVPNGHGLRWCGPRGGWRGIEIEGIGRHGIFVDGGTPVTMHDWTARRCGTLSQPKVSPWCGFYASLPAFDPEPASCTGFTIREGAGGAHQYAFRMQAADSGGPNHEHWQIRGNVRDGGPVSIPTTVQHSVDFDSDGLGDQVTVSSTTIALPDTADLVPIVPDSGNIQTITASWPGRRVTLLFTGAQTVESGTGNLKLRNGGSFGANANDTLTLICDGSTWYEVARSAN